VAEIRLHPRKQTNFFSGLVSFNEIQGQQRSEECSVLAAITFQQPRFVRGFFALRRLGASGESISIGIGPYLDITGQDGHIYVQGILGRAAKPFAKEKSRLSSIVQEDLMKRMILFALALLLLIPVWSTPLSVEAAPSVSTHAESAALIDVSSGRILYSSQGDKSMRIASLTKIMTAIVAIEHGKLSDQVTISRNAAGKEGSSIYLKLGEEMSLQHLLYGMMLRSGNDAATAIAEHVGGSVEGFAYMMNEKARLIGMEHSSFKNPSGLDEEGHYSTANDMAKLTAYALRNPVFREIVKTKVKKAPNPNETWDYTWMNKNKMLNLYDGADGVKTGYTKIAKRCLVSSATRNGQQLAVVTLNDPDDWADHTKLLDYGFKNFPLHPLVNKGDVIDGTSYVAGISFGYPALESEKNQFTSQIQMNDPASANYRLGEVGAVHYMLSGKPIGSVPLFMKGSPRLKLDDHGAFSFSGSLGGTSGGADKWLFIVQHLFRIVFTGRSA